MTIEEAIRQKLLSMDAVTAITTTFRPIELMQTDRGPTISIHVFEKNYTNDISGRCSLVDVRAVVSASSGNKAQAEALAEAIRVNGTDPGTGLAGCTVTTGGLPFQAMLIKDELEYVANQDGSNSGRYMVDSIYVLTFEETM